MQTGRSSRQQLLNGARVLARELIREPVKEAVREAIREESAAADAEQLAARSREDTDDGSGGSRFPGLAMKGVAVAMIVGIAYYARRNGGEMIGEGSQSSSIESTGAGSGPEYSSDVGGAGETGAGSAGGERAE